ncbi:hypothetical protein E3P86_00422 [Wallemia ichthyophaga]|uniref:Uncharacterized protein n=1 Tax=Wallemia ichthyophaga TaxID=245174 RepID=A0A4T0JGR0_WALIC|nr:hypothetical protein E3P86_00422 [Wallemia ichthyophaga]
MSLVDIFEATAIILNVYFTPVLLSGERAYTEQTAESQPTAVGAQPNTHERVYRSWGSSGGAKWGSGTKGWNEDAKSAQSAVIPRDNWGILRSDSTARRTSIAFIYTHR